jgi:hypothetical protein
VDKDTILLELSTDQRQLVLDNCLTLDQKLTRLFSIALKKNKTYQIPLTLEDLQITIDTLYSESNHAKDKKIVKKLDKLIDHLEDINDKFFDDVVIKDLSKMMGVEPDKIMAMAEEFAGELLADPDFEDDDDDYDDDEFDEYSKNTGKILTLKVFLARTKKIWRTIAIRQGQTLHDLHKIIFDAFDRYDEHMYSFFVPDRKISKFNPRTIHNNSQKYSHPYICEDGDEFAAAMSEFFQDDGDINAAKTQLGDLHLEPGQKFFYLFDFGDEWWHEIALENISEPDKKKYPRIIDSMGQSPDQYPDEDEDE